MKVRLSTLTPMVLLLSLLLLAGCGAAGDPGLQQGPSPAEFVTESPSVSPSPFDLVLQGTDAPGMDLAAGAFEHSVWGSSPEDVPSQITPSQYMIVDMDATFGGMSCQAYYAFESDDTLVGGYYSLNTGEEHVGGLLRAVTSYLTELYGEPRLFMDSSGQEFSDPEEFFSQGTGTIVWPLSPGGVSDPTYAPTVYSFADGEVRVAFLQNSNLS